MKEVCQSIEIHASPGQVWGILTEFSQYPNWNPFLTQIEGELKAGSKLLIQVCSPQGQRFRFKPLLLEVDPERQVKWRGRFLLPGILDGLHTFLLEQQ
ncbi:MAG: SRPBCC domain-containing protein [Synechococcaceae cyanobacterium SM2_3_1]|nr:SRPBCC domain-containing protein [Synechococcaceae cyanobacterium SM2_3_1]